MVGARSPNKIPRVLWIKSESREFGIYLYLTFAFYQQHERAPFTDAHFVWNGSEDIWWAVRFAAHLTCDSLTDSLLCAWIWCSSPLSASLGTEQIGARSKLCDTKRFTFYFLFAETFFSEVIYTLCLVFRRVFLLFGLLKCCRMVGILWVRGECHQICVWLLSDNYLHFHPMQRWSTRRTLQCHPNRTNFSRRAFLFMSDRFSQKRTFQFCAPPTRLFRGFLYTLPFLL